MKKSLFALAVLSTVAGMASAQSNVTVYGVMDMGLDFDSGKTGTAATGTQSKISVASGQTSGSRLGFKGSEDLGNGLSAIFTLESGFTADTGQLSYGGTLFGRQSWVGLKGHFGTVKLGRQTSATYLALQTLDPFTVNSAGDAQRAYGYGLGKVDPISRSDNSITYQTPTVAGFNGLLGHGFGEQAGALNKFSTSYGSVNYANGPLTVLASYQLTNGVSFAPSTTPTAGLDALLVTSGLAPTNTALVNVKNGVLGATYNFGSVKLHSEVGNTKLQATGNTTIRNYMLGFTAPIGQGNVLGSWNRTNITNVSGGVANQYAIGYNYYLSKRTDLYVVAAYTKNGNGIMENAWANGQSDRDVQIGMRHTF